MSIWEAIILGIVQGATEFLPVSSSGHSVLVPAVFNLQPPDLNAVAIAHLGTLLAVFIYFFSDIWGIAIGVINGLIQRNPLGNPDARLGWLIFVGTIPAATAGLLFEEFFENLFAAPTAAAIFLLGTAALLVLGERMRSGHKDIKDLTWVDTIIIGLFQTLALLPGISRSGSTMVGGLLRGLDRSETARYSFLLGIPAILGAGLLSVVDLMTATEVTVSLTSMVVVFITAAISGYACIHWLLQWVRQRSLIPFAVYCVAFSLFYLIFYVALG